MRVHSHYENLKVSRDAPQSVIRAAYRALSQQYHPDRNPNDERAERIMGLINRAYDVLSDAERRKAHDAWILEEEASLRQQHEEKVRQAALEQAARERARRRPLRSLRNVLAGLAVALLTAGAIFYWASEPAQTTAKAAAVVHNP